MGSRMDVFLLWRGHTFPDCDETAFGPNEAFKLTAAASLSSRGLEVVAGGCGSLTQPLGRAGFASLESCPD